MGLPGSCCAGDPHCPRYHLCWQRLGDLTAGAERLPPTVRCHKATASTDQSGNAPVLCAVLHWRQRSLPNHPDEAVAPALCPDLDTGSHSEPKICRCSCCIDPAVLRVAAECKFRVRDHPRLCASMCHSRARLQATVMSRQCCGETGSVQATTTMDCTGEWRIRIVRTHLALVSCIPLQAHDGPRFVRCSSRRFPLVPAQTLS